MAELTVVGKPVTRLDAHEKVTGEAIYGYDLVLPNMLYGKVLFSPKPHARIVRIDTEKAKRFPGVCAVITGEDAPWTHGESIKDKPFLAQGKVRYIGEPVAAVGAGGGGKGPGRVEIFAGGEGEIAGPIPPGGG